MSAGQIIPTTVVGGVASETYVPYTPSLVEISIVVAAFAFVAFVYTLAERYLDLREARCPRRLPPSGRSSPTARDRLVAAPARDVEPLEPADAIAWAATHDPPGRDAATATGSPSAPSSMAIVLDGRLHVRQHRRPGARSRPGVIAGAVQPPPEHPARRASPGPSAWAARSSPATPSAPAATRPAAGTIGLRDIPVMGHPSEGWSKCTDCHATARLVDTAPGHSGIHATECTVCHKPGNLPAPLSRPHRENQNEACLTCHGTATAPLPADMTHRKEAVCWLCHRLPTVEPPVPAHETAVGETDCLTCHRGGGSAGKLPADHLERPAEPVPVMPRGDARSDARRVAFDRGLARPVRLARAPGDAPGAAQPIAGTSSVALAVGFLPRHTARASPRHSGTGIPGVSPGAGGVDRRAGWIVRCRGGDCARPRPPGPGSRRRHRRWHRRHERRVPPDGARLERRRPPRAKAADIGHHVACRGAGRADPGHLQHEHAGEVRARAVRRGRAADEPGDGVPAEPGRSCWPRPRVASRRSGATYRWGACAAWTPR